MLSAFPAPTLPRSFMCMFVVLYFTLVSATWHTYIYVPSLPLSRPVILMPRLSSHQKGCGLLPYPGLIVSFSFHLFLPLIFVLLMLFFAGVRTLTEDVSGCVQLEGHPLCPSIIFSRHSSTTRHTVRVWELRSRKCVKTFHSAGMHASPPSVHPFRSLPASFLPHRSVLSLSCSSGPHGPYRGLRTSKPS